MTRDQISHDETCESGGVQLWSDLNHDVLLLVMMRLGVIDFLSLCGVCKSWRSFALSNWNRFMASKPPMSMRISTNVNEREERYLYLEDIDGRNFKTILPRLFGVDFVGLSCGYLAFYGKETREFWLVNPIARHQLHFPHVPFDVDGIVYARVRLILIFSPSIPGWVLVVENLLCDEIWSSIAGKGAWNLVSSRFPFRLFDFHAFMGKVYAISYTIGKKRYKFRLCKMRLDPRPKLTLLETKNYPDTNDLPLFVSSGENLYMMHYISEDWYDFHELDFGEMKWVSLEKTREEYAFF